MSRPDGGVDPPRTLTRARAPVARRPSKRRARRVVPPVKLIPVRRRGGFARCTATVASARRFPPSVEAARSTRRRNCWPRRGIAARTLVACPRLLSSGAASSARSRPLRASLNASNRSPPVWPPIRRTRVEDVRHRARACVVLGDAAPAFLVGAPRRAPRPLRRARRRSRWRSSRVLAARTAAALPRGVGGARSVDGRCKTLDARANATRARP